MVTKTTLVWRREDHRQKAAGAPYRRRSRCKSAIEPTAPRRTRRCGVDDHGAREACCTARSHRSRHDVACGAGSAAGRKRNDRTGAGRSLAVGATACLTVGICTNDAGRRSRRNHVKRIADRATYWDTSAILSALFADDHSKKAVSHAGRRGFHFVTSLGWAEAYAVIGRIERERALAKTLVDAARTSLAAGPWRRINAGPSWNTIASLARRWPLRGADLWHLATAKDLKADLPELAFLSFDQRLNVAANGEGLTYDLRS